MTSAPSVTAYLTRLRLNPRSPQAARSLGDSQVLHKIILGLLPASETRVSAQLLYRLEQGTRGHTVITQSVIPLSLDRLPVNYATAAQERDNTLLLNWLDDGRRIQYRIDAQPLRNIPKDSNGRMARGERRPIFGDEAAQWWQKQAEKRGLVPDPEGILVTQQPGIDGWKDHPEIPGKRQRVRGYRIRFEGAASISDAGALREAILNGIGRGRAYGCGLLSVAALTR